MAKRETLIAQKRDLTGRKVKRLRKDGWLPANVFGKKTDSTAIQLKTSDFAKTFEKVGETSLLEVQVEGEKSSRHVLVSSVQADPITSLPLHVDFHQVVLTEKVTANIPIVYTGEAPAVKNEGGVLVTLMDEIEVEALPTDLPDEFSVILDTLEHVGDSLDISKLKVEADKVELKAEPGALLVTIQAPKEEEVEEAPEPEAGEAEAAQPKADSDQKPEGEAAKPDAKPEEKPDDKPKKE